MSNNAQLNLIAENAKWVKEQRDEEIYPLNYTAYQNHRLLTEEEAKEVSFWLSCQSLNCSQNMCEFSVDNKDTFLKEWNQFLQDYKQYKDQIIK
jgi:carboxyl-terminal processing protease